MLFSDNATNLRGTDAELKRAVEEWSSSEAAGKFHAEGVSWTFNVPLASHRAGVFERLIRSSRRFLYEILSKDSIDITVFNTTLIVVEGILNRRPITRVSCDAKDVDALSPSDLLYPGIGSRSNVCVVPPTSISGSDFKASWKKSRGLVQKFWARWNLDYLNSLKERQKWHNSYDNLKKDQIVILVDENQPRDSWKIGRITDVLEKDGHVRAALVKLPNGKIFERDISKLVHLELDG